MIIRESIMAAVVTKLAGVKQGLVAVTINRNRSHNYSIENFPFINIKQLDEYINYDVYGKTQRELNVSIDIYIHDSTTYETELNDLYGQVIKKLRTDVTLGVSGVMDLEESSCGAIDITKDGEPTIHRLPSIIKILYRTNNDDLENI